MFAASLKYDVIFSKVRYADTKNLILYIYIYQQSLHKIFNLVEQDTKYSLYSF